MKSTRIIIIIIVLITAGYLFIREGKHSSNQRAVPLFGKRADVPPDEQAFKRSTDTKRSQIIQDINDHCIKIKVRFFGVSKGKIGRRYWVLNRKDKDFSTILVPIKLLLRSKAPVSWLIPDFGAGGYMIDFYISSDMAYRTQLAGDRFMVKAKSTDPIPNAKGESFSEHREQIELLIENCPEWFTDKMHAAIHPLWMQTEKAESSH